MLSGVPADDERWYRTCARTALDLIDEFGEARLDAIEPAHVDALRRLIVAEARRRKVKVRTHRVGACRVFVFPVERSVVAEAYLVVQSAVMFDRIDAFADGQSPPPAGTPPWTIDCALPLV